MCEVRLNTFYVAIFKLIFRNGFVLILNIKKITFAIIACARECCVEQYYVSKKR